MQIERIVPWRKTIAARDARSSWTSRHGWLVVVAHAGVRGIGECSPLPGFGGTHAAALRFALETATLDALARARGVPLAAALVDAPAARVPLNALVTDAASAASALARGVTTLKVKVGPELGRRHLDAILAAAPGVRLRLDANQTWPLDEVGAHLAALAPLPIDYVEEPAAGIGAWLARADRPAPGDAAGARDRPGTASGPGRAAPGMRLPIALDESLADPDRDSWLERALAGGAIAALILKPTILGGFAACAALAARARAHGVVAVITHALEGPVGTAACASLALALASDRATPPRVGATAARWTDVAMGLDRHPTLAAWNVDVPHLTPSSVVLPDAPGLGLDIDALLAAAEAP